MENGSLDCASASLCPDDCQVCSTCLDLLGCGGVPTIPEAWRSLKALSALYILGAAVAMLLFGLLAHYSRKRWRADRDDDLDENLMEKDGIQGERQGNGKPRNRMFLRGSDLAWRPLPSDQDYAAFQEAQPGQEPQAPPVLQPTYTMSTASTGRSPNPNNKAGFQGTRAIRDAELDTAEATATGTATSNLYGEAVFAQLGANGEPIMVPSMVDTFAGQNHDQDTNAAGMGISPIQTLEDSSVSSSALSSEDEKSEHEDPLLEDFSSSSSSSPRGTMSMTSSTDGAADQTNEIV